MAETFKIKRGSDKPWLRIVVLQAGLPVNIQGATALEFRLRKAKSNELVFRTNDGVFLTTDGSDARIEFRWPIALDPSKTIPDTYSGAASKTAGEFQGEFYFLIGTNQYRVPTERYIPIYIFEDIQ